MLIKNVSKESTDKFAKKIFNNVRMRKMLCSKYEKYTNLKSPKISYIYNRRLLISTSCGKCGSTKEKNS